MTSDTARRLAKERAMSLDITDDSAFIGCEEDFLAGWNARGGITDEMVEAGARALNPDAECWIPRDEFESRERSHGEEIWPGERAEGYLQVRLKHYDEQRSVLLGMSRAALSAALGGEGR